MLKWSLIFFLLAVGFATIGFAGQSDVITRVIAQYAFIVFMCLAVVTFVFSHREDASKE